MISTLGWLKNILSAFEDFIFPKKAYDLYIKQNIDKYYSNFFDCSYSYLFYECFLEDIEESKDLYNIPNNLFLRLKNFRDLLLNNYKSLSILDDMDLLEHSEWDEIIPLAKECYDGLKKMEEAEKNRK